VDRVTERASLPPDLDRYGEPDGRSVGVACNMHLACVRICPRELDGVGMLDVAVEGEWIRLRIVFPRGDLNEEMRGRTASG
jgi:hypothetical protein